MNRELATPATVTERGSQRFLLTVYAYMLAGYLGLALAAVGIDWTFSASADPGPFVAIPLAAVGIALTVLAWHSLYRHYTSDESGNASVKPAAGTKPVLAVVHGLPATSAR